MKINDIIEYDNCTWRIVAFNDKYKIGVIIELISGMPTEPEFLNNGVFMNYYDDHDNLFKPAISGKKYRLRHKLNLTVITNPILTETYQIY